MTHSEVMKVGGMAIKQPIKASRESEIWKLPLTKKFYQLKKKRVA